MKDQATAVMIKRRPADERGRTKLDWLQSRHTFAFGDYYDPAYVGFRSLRVINEDWIAPGQGFGTHSHHDMEIITYVLAGALQHRDSLGNGSIIRPGDVQRMSAGTGIAHSEFNPSDAEPTHLLQIWLLPRTQGIVPGYEQKHFAVEARAGRLALVAASDARDGAVGINQDADVYAGALKRGDEVSHHLEPRRHAWVQVARGKVVVNGVMLASGDGAAMSGVEHLTIAATEPAETLLFDLA